MLAPDNLTNSQLSITCNDSWAKLGGGSRAFSASKPLPLKLNPTPNHPKGYGASSNPTDETRTTPTTRNAVKRLPKLQPAPAQHDDPWKHAVEVAVATAAVAEAAVAAANAAAVVVRLTRSGRSMALRSGDVNSATCIGSSGTGILVAREEWAAVKIQSHFRANLARRAFRALKALVKLQALIRGHIVRKQTTEPLQSLQVLVRAQERTLEARKQASDTPSSTTKAPQFYHPHPTTREIYEHSIQRKDTKYDHLLIPRRYGSEKNGREVGPREKEQMAWKWLYGAGADKVLNEQNLSSRRAGSTDERNGMILEIYNKKIHYTSGCRNLFQASNIILNSDHYSHSFNTSKDCRGHQTFPSSFSCEVQSSSPLKISQNVEGSSLCSAENSPQFYSASSKGGSCRKELFTPARNDSLNGCPDHPNYMAYTESAQAKMRSLSAPKQRPQFEISGSTNRYSTNGQNDSRCSIQRVSSLRRSSTAYP